MSFCRAAWRKLGSLAHRSLMPLCKSVIPARSLAYGPPGGTGPKLAYVVLCGGSLAAAVIYAYKTIISGRENFADNVASIDAKPKDSSESQPGPAETSPEPAGGPAAMGQAAGSSGEASQSAKADSLLWEPQKLDGVPVKPMTEEPPDPVEVQTVAAEPASAEVAAADTVSSPAENDATPPTGQEVTLPVDGAAMT